MKKFKHQSRQRVKDVNRKPISWKPKRRPSLRIIALGGLGEVGRNMTLFEYRKKILIVDMGLAFPEEGMFGVDFFIPDVSYLEKKQKDILGVIITHGHYDHIGAIPYLIKKLGNPPIFASKLSRAIILKRQEEFSGSPKLNIKEVRNGSSVALEPFKIEFFRQNHNIPGNLGLIIKSPVGNIVHTSDFKFDSHPIYDPPTDFEKLRKIAERGILLLMSDSTNAEEKGSSLSEKQIMENLEKIFKQESGRIIAATFASLINRIQQIITLSEKYKRKVAVVGYSMDKNVEITRRLKYLKVENGTFIEAKKIKDYPDSKITILCTGSQGEEDAALMKITDKQHRFVKFKKGDNVILSSSIIPGNEKGIQVLKDNILRQGVKVFHYQMMDIHAGGHAKQEELEKMIRIMKPRFFMPIHGQYSMLLEHTRLAKNAGLLQENIILAENGQIINVNPEKISVLEEEVPSSYVMVDGLGIGDVGEVVLRDRKILSKDGMFVVITVINYQTGKVKGSPDIISRGFVYLKESKGLLAQTRRKVIEIVNRAGATQKPINLVHLKNNIRNKIGDFLFTKTKRRPMILPVIIKV